MAGMLVSHGPEGRGEEFARLERRKGVISMPTTVERPKPFLLPQFCKGCGRCIEACAKHCIEAGTEINPDTGLLARLENQAATMEVFESGSLTPMEDAVEGDRSDAVKEEDPYDSF